MLSTLCPPNTGKDEMESHNKIRKLHFPSPPSPNNNGDQPQTEIEDRGGDGCEGVWIPGCSGLSFLGGDPTAFTIEKIGDKSQSRL